MLSEGRLSMHVAPVHRDIHHFVSDVMVTDSEGTLLENCTAYKCLKWNLRSSKHVGQYSSTQ